jgi:hypothetical protein
MSVTKKQSLVTLAAYSVRMGGKLPPSVYSVINNGVGRQKSMAPGTPERIRKKVFGEKKNRSKTIHDKTYPNN